MKKPSFIEIKFIYNELHLLQVYHLVSSPIYTPETVLTSDTEHLHHHPQRVLQAPFYSLSPAPPPSPPHPIFLSP